MSTTSDVLRILEENRGECVSGNEISNMLNMSRNAVWKAVQKLRDEGYKITSKQSLGYRLDSMDDRLSVEGIERFITDKDVKLYVLSETDSTNEYAKGLARNHAKHKTIVLADGQSAGKGRMGRSFHSPSGKGLYMSILLRPDFSSRGALIVTSAAAVAVAEAIEGVSGWKDEVDVKWVNDLYINGKKICGILTEASINWENGAAEFIVIGIGINVRRDINLPEDLAEVYGFLYGQGGVTRNQLAGAVITRVLEIMDELESEKEKTAEYVIEESRRRSCVLGREVYVDNTESPPVLLTAVDLDENGGLVVADEDGNTFTLSVGEVSVRI